MEYDLWKKVGLAPPKLFKAINPKSGEMYIVIEDEGTVFKLINKTGQIYVVAAFRCQIVQNGKDKIYSCGEPIHPISCSKIDNPRERFAETLVYLLK